MKDMYKVFYIKWFPSPSATREVFPGILGPLGGIYFFFLDYKGRDQGRKG